MNYKRTLEYLFSQLPMYQRQGAPAFKKDLSNTLKLCELLGQPHTKFKNIHIAGTNGKGSVSHMLASVFQESGFKVGLYTSPHLTDFRERIKINGEMIPEQSVIGFAENHKADFEDIKPSFF
jgi:dihydrofolate synthase/folylpolyglutamate synthase